MKFKTVFIILAHLNLSAQNNFEGSIRFITEIATSGVDKDEFKKELYAKYGDSLIVYYSKAGVLIREYLNSANLGNHFQVYNPKSGVVYLLSRNSTKIDTLDVKINSLSLTSKKKIKSDSIIGLTCDCYEYSATSKYDVKVMLNYCFSKKTPKINSKLLEKHNDFFLNDYYKNSKRPYLKFSIETSEFKITQIASEIKKHPIDQDMYKTK
jgi:hypothetical protein